MNNLLKLFLSVFLLFLTFFFLGSLSNSQVSANCGDCGPGIGGCGGTICQPINCVGGCCVAGDPLGGCECDGCACDEQICQSGNCTGNCPTPEPPPPPPPPDDPYCGDGICNEGCSCVEDCGGCGGCVPNCGGGCGGGDGCGGICGCGGGETCSNGTCVSAPGATATPVADCDPKGGETCGTTRCCPSCTSQQRNCESVNSTECSKPEDCPNLSSQEQCGVAGCYVQKNCVNNSCQYTCLGTNCDTSPGATPYPTPTPGTTTKTIRGLKVMHGGDPNNTKVPAYWTSGNRKYVSYYGPNFPANIQEIKYDGDYPQTSNPFSYTFLGIIGGEHSISAKKIDGYELLYSICYNQDWLPPDPPSCSNHDGRLYRADESNSADGITGRCDNDSCEIDIHDQKYQSFATLYWHYIPLPTCQITNLNGAGPYLVNQTLSFKVDAAVPSTTATQIERGDHTYLGLGAYLEQSQAQISPGSLIASSNCGMSGGLSADPKVSCSFTGSFVPTVPGDYYVSCRANNMNTNNFGNTGVDPILHGCQPFPVSPELVPPPVHQYSGVAQPFDARCSSQDSILIKVKEPGPWWQAKDADITSGQDIISPILASCTGSCIGRLILDGAGGFPGVPVLGGANADFSGGRGTSDISSKDWISGPNTDAISSVQKFDFKYYLDKIPEDVENNFFRITTNNFNGGNFISPGTPSRGYRWFYYDGNLYGNQLTIGNFNNPANNKVVLIVDNADLIINGNIAQSTGKSFFMAIVERNIIINHTVGGSNNNPDVEAALIANGDITTSSNGIGVDGTDLTLKFRGVAISVNGSIVLDRDLANDTQTPAELFEYAPDMLFLYPSIFYDRSLKWKEVAP